MEDNFPNRLKRLREKRKWTKVQAAKAIGITPGAYGNYEYGRVSGDEPTVFYQINSGLLGIINEGLADIQEVIKGVSDEICPD